MKKITLLVAFLVATLGFSQEVIQNFEAAGALFEAPFGGMPVPTIVTGTGSNTSQVLQIVANSGAEVWQGQNVNITKNVLLTTTKTMSIDVKSATPITFLVKVNAGVSGAVDAAAAVTHNGDNTWQTLNFTFNTALDGKAATANGEYGRMVIHAYWAPAAVGFGDVTKDERTFFVDNIFGVAVTPVVVAPTTAPPVAPERLATDVVSIFSPTYSNVTLNELPTSWSQNGTFNASFNAGGVNVWQIGDGNEFLGMVTNYDTGIDLTEMTKMHIDYWTKDPQGISVKIVNTVDGGEAIQSLGTTGTDGWQSVDLDMANFAVNRSKITQILIDPETANKMFVANFYFHKNTSLSTKNFQIAGLNVYPNPSQNQWTIKTQNVVMNYIQVFDVLGKNVLNIAANKAEATINGTSLKSGLYFAKITTNTGTSSLKLVKK